MTWFAKAKNSWVVAIVALVAAGAVVAWKVDTRSSARAEKDRQERIGKDARGSIGRAMDGVQMCPLSQPDCNKK